MGQGEVNYKLLFWITLALVVLVIVSLAGYLVGSGKIKLGTLLPFPRPSPSPATLVLPPPIVKEAKECSNTQKGYSLIYPASVFTKERNENEKCAFFSFSDFDFPPAWGGPLTPIFLELRNKPQAQVVSEVAGQLTNVVSGRFVLSGDYEASFVSGTWPKGAFLEGRLYAVLVQKDQNTTLLAQLYNGTPEQTEIFESIVKSLKFQ